MLLELSFGFAMVLLLFTVGQGTLWGPYIHIRIILKNITPTTLPVLFVKDEKRPGLWPGRFCTHKTSRPEPGRFSKNRVLANILEIVAEKSLPGISSTYGKKNSEKSKNVQAL
jgi:hypothetical protein